MNARHLNVRHPLTGGQRALDDVLVRVTEIGGPTVVQYMSHGRAAMALARYSRARAATHHNQRFIVERLEPKREGS